MRAVIRHFRCVMLVASMAVGVAACSEVPKEAVTLSVTIGQDLEEIHRSHRELVQRYFKRSRDDANRWVDEVYRPAFINKAILESTYEYEEGKPPKPFLEIIEAEAQRDDGDPLFYLDFFVQDAVSLIESTRAELIGPIDKQERSVLQTIDDAYSKVRNAHAIITGHLASVRNVQQAQDDLLADVGLKDIRKKIIIQVADISDKAANVLAGARKAEATIDDLDKAVSEAKDLWNSTIK